MSVTVKRPFLPKHSLTRAGQFGMGVEDFLKFRRRWPEDEVTHRRVSLYRAQPYTPDQTQKSAAVPAPEDDFDPGVPRGS